MVQPKEWLYYQIWVDWVISQRLKHQKKGWGLKYQRFWNIFFTWWLIGRNATVKIMVWNGFIHLKSRDIVNRLWIEQWTRPNSGLTIKTMEFNQQYRRLKQVKQKGIGYRDNWWLICYYWFHKRMEVGRDGWWYFLSPRRKLGAFDCWMYAT